ncbi:hypothetical protein D3C80_1738850 [compost metagenome]
MPGSPGISKPKYGASREMSHSCRPESSHSASLLATASCKVPLRVHCCSMAWKSGSLKKKCWESRSTGVAPEMADLGFFSSVGA